MENNVYSAPQSELELSSCEGDMLATRGSRLLAAIVDALTIMPITIPLMYFTGGFDGLQQGIQPPLWYTLTMALAGAAIFLCIHGKILIRDGQTWGKKSQNIKIVTLDDEHVTLSILLKRYGFYWGVPQIPLAGQLISMVNILFIFGKSKRCLHDYVAGTKVVSCVKPKRN